MIASAVRLLIVPGLHGSGPGHWQSWLERQTPGSVRVSPGDWGMPDPLRWAAAVDEALRREPAQAWVAVAHGFGCLALAHHAAQGGRGIHGAVLVGMADPDRFQLDERALAQPLPFPSTLAVCPHDPWMSPADAGYFGGRWGSEIVEASDAGRVDSMAGNGPWPAVAQWVAAHVQRVASSLRPREVGAAQALGFAI